MQSYIEEVRPTKKNNTHLHLDRNSFRLGPFNWCTICVVIQHWVQCGYSNDASFHLVRYLCFMYIYSVIIARTWMNRASIRTHVACSSFIKKKNSPFNEPVDGHILWLMTWWHCLSVLIWNFPETFSNLILRRRAALNNSRFIFWNLWAHERANGKTYLRQSFNVKL